MRYTYKSPTYIISCFIYKYIVDQYPTKAGTAWVHLHLRFFSDTVQYYKSIFSHDLTTVPSLTHYILSTVCNTYTN